MAANQGVVFSFPDQDGRAKKFSVSFRTKLCANPTNPENPKTKEVLVLKLLGPSDADLETAIGDGRRFLDFIDRAKKLGKETIAEAGPEKEKAIKDINAERRKMLLSMQQDHHLPVHREIKKDNASNMDEIKSKKMPPPPPAAAAAAGTKRSTMISVTVSDASKSTAKKLQQEGRAGARLKPGDGSQKPLTKGQKMTRKLQSDLGRPPRSLVQPNASSSRALDKANHQTLPKLRDQRKDNIKPVDESKVSAIAAAAAAAASSSCTNLSSQMDRFFSDDVHKNLDNQAAAITAAAGDDEGSSRVIDYSKRLERSKRKLEEGYQREESKRSKTKILELHELPKADMIFTESRTSKNKKPPPSVNHQRSWRRN